MDESFIVQLEFYHKTHPSAVNRIVHSEQINSFGFDMLFQVAMLPRIGFLFNTKKDMDIYLKTRWKLKNWPEKVRCYIHLKKSNISL